MHTMHSELASLRVCERENLLVLCLLHIRSPACLCVLSSTVPSICSSTRRSSLHILLIRAGLSRVRRLGCSWGLLLGLWPICLRPASLFSMLLCLGGELSCVWVGNLIIWRTNSKYTNNHWVAPKPWPPGYCMKKHHWKGSQCWDFFWRNPYVNGGSHKHSVEPWLFLAANISLRKCVCGGRRLTSDVFLSHSLLYLLNPELTSLANLARQPVLGIVCLSP